MLMLTPLIPTIMNYRYANISIDVQRIRGDIRRCFRIAFSRRCFARHLRWPCHNRRLLSGVFGVVPPARFASSAPQDVSSLARRCPPRSHALARASFPHRPHEAHHSGSHGPCRGEAACSNEVKRASLEPPHREILESVMDVTKGNCDRITASNGSQLLSGVNKPSRATAIEMY